MTIAQAFNDIAVAQGGTASKNGSIASAIDALNDALAGSDQPAASTIEGAVRLLGQHIGGGGGGSFGSLQYIVIEEALPEVENYMSGMPQLLSISSGDTVYALGNTGVPITNSIAAGLTAVSYSDAQYTECDAYVCGVDEYYVYTSVAPWDGTVTVGSMEQYGNTFTTYTLTVPELDFDPETGTGEYLVLYVHDA